MYFPYLGFRPTRLLRETLPRNSRRALTRSAVLRATFNNTYICVRYYTTRRLFSDWQIINMDSIRSFVNLEGGSGSRTLAAVGTGEQQSGLLPEVCRSCCLIIDNHSICNKSYANDPVLFRSSALYALLPSSLCT